MDHSTRLQNPSHLEAHGTQLPVPYTKALSSRDSLVLPPSCDASHEGGCNASAGSKRYASASFICVRSIPQPWSPLVLQRAKTRGRGSIATRSPAAPARANPSLGGLSGTNRRPGSVARRGRRFIRTYQSSLARPCEPPRTFVEFFCSNMGAIVSRVRAAELECFVSRMSRRWTCTGTLHSDRETTGT